MTPSIEIGPFTQYEVPPPLSYQYTDENDQPINISGCSVKVAFGIADGTPISAAGELDNAAQGKVLYTWTDDDLAIPGQYAMDIWAISDSPLRRYASERLIFEVTPAVTDPR